MLEKGVVGVLTNGFFFISRHSGFIKQMHSRALTTILGTTKETGEKSRQQFVNNKIQKMEFISYTQTTA
ncbi:hypothetical protein Y71_22125 [Kosakonia radicincitans DSM 16656]|nr:hypothetical protein A3780_02830 [Kosakonia radicincitans]ARD62476.1 hypothetical protein Y71_22125 [Kosakonia radicincitans DSM 16656]NCF07112.1 hypothetical protein [Kosakonia sp. MH5]QEM93161.1 hypothetical protein FEI17_22125 [Kosakonia radicincitans]